MNLICDYPKLSNKKILFLAETHFQIINCINIALHTENCRCDLYINAMYSNTEEIVNTIRNFEIFDSICTYKSNQSNIYKAFKFLNAKNNILRLFQGFDYDVVFFASRNFVARCVITYCKYINPCISLIAYDEGLGTYTSIMEGYTNNIEKTIIKLKYHVIPDIITDKILYKPEAYIGDANNIKIYRMPPFTKEAVRIINTLYNYDESMSVSDKYIYFDRYFDERESINKIVINELVNKTNGRMVIKLHPQTQGNSYNVGKIYQFPNLPYEVIALNDEDIESKVLITCVSTSVWTPMLLFDKHPRIILLYPLYDAPDVIESRAIIEKMISLYDRKKITVVRNKQELDSLEL